MKKDIRVINGFVIKIIAMISMTFDHLGAFLYIYGGATNSTVYYIFTLIGRLAFPLFTFLLIEGIYHTKNEKKYLLRLGILTLIVMVPHIILYYTFVRILLSNPILELFLLALVCIFLKKKGAKKLYSLIPIAYIILCYSIDLYEMLNKSYVLWLPPYIRCNYSIFGLLVALGFFFARPLTNYIYKVRGIDVEGYTETSQYQFSINLISVASLFIVVAIFYLVARFSTDASGFSYLDSFTISQESYCLISTILIVLYNGKRGYDSKAWRIFSYTYFPLHIVILAAIFIIKYGIIF